MNASSIVRFGVIGCSRIALKSVLPALHNLGSVELAMIGSRTAETAQRVAAQYHAKAWGTYERVIESDAIDAVYISLPNALHEEWVLRALRAGKHVICEKPAALSYVAARNMVATARRSGARLLEGLMFRYHPQHAHVRNLIEEGALGDVLRVEGCFGYAMPEKNSNSMSGELGGGSLHACAVYPIAASRMIFKEEPTGVFCNLVMAAESGVDTEAHLILQYPKGRVAFLSSLFGSYYQSTYGVLGTKAHIRVARAYAVPRDMETKILLDVNDQIQETMIPPADHFALMVDDFCSVISKRRTNDSYEDDLVAQSRVLDAARLSARESRLVQISEIV